MTNISRTRATIGSALVGILLLSACTTSTTDHDDGHRGGHADTGDFGHVHGLVLASDGRVLLGTHYGVFSVEEGSIHGPHGEFGHDMMSFVMGQDGTLYGSGHPDHDRGWPSAMGLVRSDDDGETWESVSLMGEVDFHDLEIRGDLFYGYNSGTAQVLVSDDGHAWTAGAQIALYDIAVSPNDSGLLIGATPDGLAVSRDGGNSFALLLDAPSEPYKVLWRDNGEIVVVDFAGQVYVSGDTTGPWTMTGSLPEPPQAMITVGDSELYAALPEGVYHSADRGQTWERLDSR